MHASTEEQDSTREEGEGEKETYIEEKSQKRMDEANKVLLAAIVCVLINLLSAFEKQTLIFSSLFSCSLPYQNYTSKLRNPSK